MSLGGRFHLYVVSCSHVVNFVIDILYRRHFQRWYTEKKVEPKRLQSEAVLENGATLEGGAVFSLIIMFRKKTAPPSKWHRLLD